MNLETTMENDKKRTKKSLCQAQMLTAAKEIQQELDFPPNIRIVKTFMRWWEFLKNILLHTKWEKVLVENDSKVDYTSTAMWYSNENLFLMKIFSVSCKRFEEVHQFIYIMVLRVSFEPFCVFYPFHSSECWFNASLYFNSRRRNKQCK